MCSCHLRYLDLTFVWLLLCEVLCATIHETQNIPFSHLTTICKHCLLIKTSSVHFLADEVKTIGLASRQLLCSHPKPAARYIAGKNQRSFNKYPYLYIIVLHLSLLQYILIYLIRVYLITKLLKQLSLCWQSNLPCIKIYSQCHMWREKLITFKTRIISVSVAS